jgi:hypothetical protein
MSRDVTVFVTPTKTALRSRVDRKAVSRWRHYTEAEGLEPPSGCPRRISSAVPYQLGLRLLLLYPCPSVGTGGFEPPTPRSRSECSTGLSHVPNRLMERTGWDSNPRGLLDPTRFPIVLLKPLGHPSLLRTDRASQWPTAPTFSTARRGWDSNPRTPCERHGLANRSLGPLGHLSTRTGAAGFEPAILGLTVRCFASSATPHYARFARLSSVHSLQSSVTEDRRLTTEDPTYIAPPGVEPGLS